MSLEIIAKPVVWAANDFIEMKVTVHYPEKFDTLRLTLCSSQEDSYKVCEPATQQFTPKAATKTYKIRISHLDECSLADDNEKHKLGKIQLRFQLDAVVVRGIQVPRPDQAKQKVELEVWSPYAYALDDPNTSHGNRKLADKLLLRVERKNCLDKILAGVTKTPQQVVWLHGPPGSGKTALFQDLQESLLKQIKNCPPEPLPQGECWLPVVISLTADMPKILQVGWRFALKVDREINTILKSFLELDYEAELTEKFYRDDLYLSASAVFHRDIARALKTKNCNILLILDGFYHFEPQVDLEELYSNLIRLISEIKEGSRRRFKLLITDVMSFEARLGQPGTPKDEWLQALAEDIDNLEIPFFSLDEIETLFTLFKPSCIKDLPNRLLRCTDGHPGLLKAILHHSKWLYCKDDRNALELDSATAHQLRERYYKSGFINDQENMVFECLLNREDAREKLTNTQINAQRITEALESLIEKKLAKKDNGAKWPVPKK